MVLIVVGNLVQINVYLIIPSVILLTLAWIFLMYCRRVILGCKQLFLQKKNQIFHFYAETINGLTQISIFNRRKSQFIKFASIINDSIKSSIGFDVVSRGFSYY